MLLALKFNNQVFNHKKKNDTMKDMTENTIILCENPSVKDLLVKEFKMVCTNRGEKGQKEYCDYVIPDTQDKYPAITDYMVDYLPTSIIRIDSVQTITFSIEASFIMQAENPEDIWFASEYRGKISIYPFVSFKYYREIWEEGIIRVYQDYCSGRFGCYQGYWTGDINSAITGG